MLVILSKILMRYLIKLYLIKDEFITDDLKEFFLKTNKPQPPKFPNCS